VNALGFCGLSKKDTSNEVARNDKEKSDPDGTAVLGDSETHVVEHDEQHGEST
jgi:hypothetical protein